MEVEVNTIEEIEGETVYEWLVEKKGKSIVIGKRKKSKKFTKAMQDWVDLSKMELEFTLSTVKQIHQRMCNESKIFPSINLLSWHEASSQIKI